MKKYFMSVAAMAGMMTLAACSSDDAVVNDGSNDVQTIQIAVASTGDHATRSRELNSEEPGQNIEKVTVVIRDANNKVVYTHTIENWNNDQTSTVYTDNGHGRSAILQLEGDDRLAKGKYTITAVGYTDADFTDNTVTTTSKESTEAGNFTAVVKGDKAQEAFAGESSIELLANHAAINTSVTLHRQVAGYYGYFTSVPVKIGDKEVAYVRLVARSKNTKLEFGNFNSDFTDAASGNIMYVVNGSVPATADAKFNGSETDDAYVLYDIEVNKWFTKGDTNQDGILDEKDDWTNALANNGYETYQKGTIFAGGFAVPFAATADKKTLELQLLDADGNILKAIDVTMGTAQTAGNILGSDTKTVETNSAFSFFRNHMYTIGKKLDNTTTQGTTPDEPEPLDKTQSITLRVNDNWEVINHLVLGE